MRCSVVPFRRRQGELSDREYHLKKSSPYRFPRRFLLVPQRSLGLLEAAVGKTPGNHVSCSDRSLTPRLNIGIYVSGLAFLSRTKSGQQCFSPSCLIGIVWRAGRIEATVEPRACAADRMLDLVDHGVNGKTCRFITQRNAQFGIQDRQPSAETRYRLAVCCKEAGRCRYACKALDVEPFS